MINLQKLILYVDVMKKALSATLLYLPSMIFACDACLCKSLLDIVVENNTDTECHLIQQTINAGLSFTKKLPITIAPGETSTAYSMWGATVDVVLGFQCGDDQFATFNTSLGGGAKPKSVIGTTLSLANLDANFTAIPAACDLSIPTARTIHWTLQ